MTQDDRKKIYAALSAPFPSEAVERTEARVTGRGYSTTGIKYQFIVNRLNEVLGVGGFRVERKIDVKEIATSKGRPAFEATCETRIQLGEWIGGAFVPFAEAIGDGGHAATALVDAIKGAFTNGLKKTAAFFGVGRQAYEGTIDDDHVQSEEPQPHPRAERQPPELAIATPATPSTQSTRSRLSSKQYAALNSLGRARGYDHRALSDHARRRFGVELSHLSRSQASELITELSASSNGRGNGHAAQPAGQP